MTAGRLQSTEVGRVTSSPLFRGGKEGTGGSPGDQRVRLAFGKEEFDAQSCRDSGSSEQGVTFMN